MLANHPLTFIFGIAPFETIRDIGKLDRPEPQPVTSALVQLVQLLARQAAREHAMANQSMQITAEC